MRSWPWGCSKVRRLGGEVEAAEHDQRVGDVREAVDRFGADRDAPGEPPRDGLRGDQPEVRREHDGPDPANSARAVHQ